MKKRNDSLLMGILILIVLALYLGYLRIVHNYDLKMMGSSLMVVLMLSGTIFVTIVFGRLFFSGQVLDKLDRVNDYFIMKLNGFKTSRKKKRKPSF